MLASDQPLVADDQSAWTFEPEILSASGNPSIDAQSFEQADPSLGRHPGHHHQLVPSTQQLLDEAKKNRIELRARIHRLNYELHQELTFLDSSLSTKP